MSSNDDDRCGGSAPSDIKRRRHHRNRRSRAAADGNHLPTLRELALGSEWFQKSVLEDASEWAERGLYRIDKKSEVGGNVAMRMAALAAEPSPDDFLYARDEVKFSMGKSAASDYRGPNLEHMLDRLEYYCASVGWLESCLRVAQSIAGRACASDCPTDESAILFEAALGWLCAARSCKPLANHQAVRNGGIVGLTRRDAETLGGVAVKEILKANESEFASIFEDVDDDKAANTKPAVPKPASVPQLREPMLAQAAKDSLSPAEHVDDDKLVDSAVVVRVIGSPETHEGKRIAEAYKSIVGKPLPLAVVPDLDGVRAALTGEFPHAVPVISAVLGDLANRRHVRMRTVFVSPPGTGKTTFAVRLLELLGIEHQVYPCGGVSDASFAGTPRQWSTGGVSAPVSLIARHRTASPGIVLDEIQRVGSGRHNGNLLDALVGMTEPVSAFRWLDPFLQTECDLSHAVWLATANDLDGVPAALRDRFRIIRFPEPGPEHLDALAASLLHAEIEERGLSPAWALPLDGTEKSMLAEHWNGGSIRKLRRLVQGVLAARDMPVVGRA